jgi:hypothetical protein
MSDDGYYPGSPYDDLDDIYYDDDAGENLADDLAQHTLPSPIYHEDPAYEMLEYFSDWEYYSDDYYDDDPALLKGDPQTGPPAKRKVKSEKSQPRGKKRKLADTQDIPELDLDDRPALAATIRGTVWAGPKPQSPKPYEVGQGQRIALLKNWAQIFERSSPRSILKRDESWANNLSLEDMGLVKVVSAPGQDDGVPAPDEDEVGGDDEMDDARSEEDMNGKILDRFDDNADEGKYHEKERMEEDDKQKANLNKRQRTMAPMPSPPPSNNSSNTSTDTIVKDMKNTSMQAMDGMESTKSLAGRVSKRKYPQLTQPKQVEIADKNVNGRKRKASPGAEPTEGIAERSTASSRAKRVASSKLATTKEQKPPPVPSTARTTRSRKN